MLKKQIGQLNDFVHKDRDCDVNLYIKGLHSNKKHKLTDGI